MFYKFFVTWLIIITLTACSDGQSESDVYCLNKSQNCAAEGHQQVFLELAQPLQIEHPISINLRLPADWAVANVKGKLVGANMEMGRIPVPFSPTNRKNEFQALLLIVACTRPDMVWRLEVEVESDHPTRHEVLQWTFSTKHME